MKSKAINTITILIFIIFYGCMSMERKQQWFIDEMNYNVGRDYKNIPVPTPSSITPIGHGESEYLIEFKKSGCQFIYVVEDKTSKVLSWRYVSEPEKCYLEIDWGGPW